MFDSINSRAVNKQLKLKWRKNVLKKGKNIKLQYYNNTEKT